MGSEVRIYSDPLKSSGMVVGRGFSRHEDFCLFELKIDLEASRMFLNGFEIRFEAKLRQGTAKLLRRLIQFLSWWSFFEFHDEVPRL